MSQEPYIPAKEDNLPGCPIPTAHRRLRHAHTLWHQALDHYHNADKFHANLNATIEALRSTTLVLQKEKAIFPDFNGWYGPWQKKLQDDVTSKWLNDARVTVFHKGDLDSYSFAEVRLATWREEVLSTIAVPIQTPSHFILQNPDLLNLLDPLKKDSWELEDAVLLIERRWSTKELQGKEVLTALAHVYGLIADLILDAHSHLGHMNCIPSDAPHRDFPSQHDRTGMLRCMIANVEARTERFKQSTHERLVPSSVMQPTDVDSREVIHRYGPEDQLSDGEMQRLDPLALAQKLQYLAKRILRRDKQHTRMMFIRDGDGKWHHLSLIAEDRTEKHVLMQLVAQFVETHGCDAVIEIGELWTAQVSDAFPKVIRNVESIPGREEALGVIVASRDGLLRWYLTPIKRGPFGGIKLGDTIQLEKQQPFYFQPIIEVWHKQGQFRAQDGRQSRVWEPDALDLCPCGGPARYGECCRSGIRKRHETRDAKPEREQTVGIRDIKFTEDDARVSLAQYVIWVKQHTTAALQGGAAGQEFYEMIVQIDALALESHIDVMVQALSRANRTDLILPQLRRLRELVTVPRLARRVTAIASRWLFEAARSEEAVLELDALGSVTDVNDSLALSLIARNFDLTDKEKKRVLQKAIEVAACDEERQLAQLSLAAYLSKGAELNEALLLVRSVIKETNGDLSSSERSAALILLWKITGDDKDFRVALFEMENGDQQTYRYRNGIYLIDGGKYAEAERLLAQLIDAGDIEAKLLICDARLRSGEKESANELFSTIRPDNVPARLQFAYAVTVSLLVLAGGLVDLRDNAILLLDRLSPAGGEQDTQVRSLLQSLRSLPHETTGKGNPAGREHSGTFK